jgi:hemerythrin-like metal-binding protein
MVVDDDPSVLQVIGDALGVEGIDAVLVSSARAAIGALDAGIRPSAILLDLLMPKVSGLDLLDELRQHPMACGVPIIVMSASPQLLENARLMRPEAELPKPFDLDALYGTLAGLCAAEGLVLGIETIDAEHRLQVERAEAVVEAVRDGREQQAVARRLERLHDSSRSHFLSEGLLMRRHAYPDCAGHMREHARSLGEIEELTTAFMAGTRPLTLGVASALRDSIEDHIRTMDHDFARYLAAQPSI